MKTSQIFLFLLLYFASIGLQIAQSQPAAISPFGIHGENRYVFDNALMDAGIKTVRYSGPLPVWDWIEQAPGVYTWNPLDSLVNKTFDSNIRIILTVRSFNRWDQGVTGPPAGSQLFPKNIEAYKQFLTAMVERYDGDGIEDAAGSPVVEYFQIENEVDGNFWDDTPEKYGELLKIAYETVKAANPNAKVIIAGVSIARGFFDYYVPVFDYLSANADSVGLSCFDIFDLHWYGAADEYNELGGYSFAGFLASVRNELASRGWDRDIPIWVSETATYGGKDVVNKKGELLPQQDERVQAGNLIHRYVSYIANGAEAVMWYKMMETHHTGEMGVSNDYFENTGLINNPLNSDSLSHKKLAYYTFKFLIDKLEGADWAAIQTIREADNFHVYKFTKVETSEPVYVAWWDWFDEPGYSGGETKDVTLQVGSLDSVRVTQAVPDAESGADLNKNDYPAFFASATLPVINGTVTISLGETPVFVEAESLPTITELPFESSRFGIFGAYALEYRWFMRQMGFIDSDYWNWVDGHFVNLGTHWTRSNTQLIWALIDPDLDGNYVWNIITNPDGVITNVYDSPAGVNWLGSIHLGLEPDGSFRNPLDHPTEWQNFIMAAVDRYNGDGNNDLNESVHVKYWQFGNEIFQLKEANLTPDDYAEIVALSESAIHAVDPEAKICLVAPTNADAVDPFLQLTIQALADRGVPLDVIDIHHWDTAGNYKMKALPAYRQLLDSLSYKNVEIWSAENGTYCYQPAGAPFQTKAEQAASLVKRYLWNFANGLDKLFWNNLMEWHGFAGFDGSIFNSMGLIGDGAYNGEPPAEFNHIRKSYYSYKKLAENIDAHKAEFVGESNFHDEANGNSGYIYRDLATGALLQFIWTETDKLVYSFSITTSHEWTNLIPIDEAGGFASRILSPGNHAITIKAGEVFLLKEASITSVGDENGSPAANEFVLKQNYPNPFNPQTTIEYQLPQPGHVALHILNVQGQEVRMVVDENQPAGSYSVVWDGKDNFGKEAAGGIYFLQMRMKEFVQTKKLLFLK